MQVGDRVKKGQTLGIVEAMKLMNNIESEYDGTVTEIGKKWTECKSITSRCSGSDKEVV